MRAQSPTPRGTGHAQGSLIVIIMIIIISIVISIIIISTVIVIIIIIIIIIISIIIPEAALHRASASAWSIPPGAAYTQSP